MKIVDTSVDIIKTEESDNAIYATVRFIVDKNCAAQFGMDHTMCLYEWAGYPTGKDKELRFIYPLWIGHDPQTYEIWCRTCETAEENFMKLLDWGYTVSEAECVLPAVTAFEVTITDNLGAWRSFLNFYLHKSTCCSAIKVAEILLDKFQEMYREKFKDIIAEDSEERDK